MKCPTCEHEMPELGAFWDEAAGVCIVDGVKSDHMSHTMFRLAKALFDNSPNIMSRLRLHDVLYSERDDGGPYDKIVDIWICRLRMALGPVDLIIQNVWGAGYVMIRKPPGWKPESTAGGQKLYRASKQRVPSHSALAQERVRRRAREPAQ